MKFSEKIRDAYSWTTIIVNFHDDINISKGEDLLRRYNLISVSTGYHGNNVTDYEIAVPINQEGYYIDMLEQEPIVESAYEIKPY